MQYKGIDLLKIVHSSVLVQWNGKTIYIDPWSNDGKFDYSSHPKADYVFITHEHFDHCDPQLIDFICKDDAVIVGNERVKEELRIDQSTPEAVGLRLARSVKLVGPKEKYGFDNFFVETVSAYNLNKFRSPGVPFHPKENNGVGYILNLGGTRIFHMGDTDNIPELSNVTDIDVLLAPMSGTFVMKPEEAAEAVKVIKPEIAIPIHWGELVGGMEEVEEFRNLVECEVELAI